MTKNELKRLIKAVENNLTVFIGSYFYDLDVFYKAKGYRSLLDRGLDFYEFFCEMPNVPKGIVKLESRYIEADRVFIEGQLLSDLIMEDINKMIRRKKKEV